MGNNIEVSVAFDIHELASGQPFSVEGVDSTNHIEFGAALLEKKNTAKFENQLGCLQHCLLLEMVHLGLTLKSHKHGATAKCQALAQAMNERNHQPGSKLAQIQGNCEPRNSFSVKIGL